jgi:hypothetical protein
LAEISTVDDSFPADFRGIIADNKTAKELEERAKKLKPSGPPPQLSPVGRAVHFLRGMNSRANFALPAFYLFLGASQGGENECCVEDYPGAVLKHSLEFSSINTISLACRKVFDHKPKGLTGASFAKTSDETIMKVASYWAAQSSREKEEAIIALHLLRSLFSECSRNDAALLDTRKSSTLGRRIAVLKQHANREAAHLSLEYYEFTILDCAHVVAALCLLGEIVNSFDSPNAEPKYYDNLDVAAHKAAKSIFPGLPEQRLFQEMKVEMQAGLSWQWSIERGKHMFLEQLPHAIGWW